MTASQGNLPQESNPTPASPTALQTPGVSIAALVLGILSLLFCCLSGIPALVLGIIGLKKANADPDNIGGKGLAIAGIVLGSIASVMTIFIAMLALIAVPNFMTLESRAYDASAVSAGRNARLAEEVYFQNYGEEMGGTYTCDMDKLLTVDRNLLDDPGVQWEFGDCNQQGYTFTVWHEKSDAEPHVMTD
ncbi:MAG: DUF4190 domain-containing protein [Candidatus Alcyoniella australis]|nr:DUF4190 domain-containing protein [Candidatus Alcyoniella australis]